MIEVKFARTRYVYESYTDFWNLVELSGFKTVFVDEIDVSDESIYIICPANGELRPHIDNQWNKPRNAHLILWCLERPSGSAGSVGEFARQSQRLMAGLWEDGRPARTRFVDEVWTSDRQLALETKTRFVVLGSNEGLGSPGTDKRYNFCHISYMVGRRTSIYKHFGNIGPNCWGRERDEVLKASKFALNIHQDEHPFQEPLRLALFAAYGIPILTETILDSYPWSDEFCVYSEYHNIIGKLNEMLIADYEPYRQMGLRARERLCGEFEFGKMVHKAVEESVGAWR